LAPVSLAGAFAAAAASEGVAAVSVADIRADVPESDIGIADESGVTAAAPVVSPAAGERDRSPPQPAARPSASSAAGHLNTFRCCGDTMVCRSFP
jgi:hypothetical protein